MPIVWPGKKDFAFTIFDDTDRATVQNVGDVYRLLADLGFRTTKSCWSMAGSPRNEASGSTCEESDYAKWLLDLQSQGFEIAFHGASPQSSRRETVIKALQSFEQMFGHAPFCYANHRDNMDNIYWGRWRLSGLHRFIYSLLMMRRQHTFEGHKECSAWFWGDVCKQKVLYVRNCVYSDINTLKVCPMMPYHDPLRPYVRFWFASADGGRVETFNKCISEAQQDRLEQEHGACIMYTHFAAGFLEHGKINGRFRILMERLSRKNGWFVPVHDLLEHLRRTNGDRIISAPERRRLERRWLLEKMFRGTT